MTIGNDLNLAVLENSYTRIACTKIKPVAGVVIVSLHTIPLSVIANQIYCIRPDMYRTVIHVHSISCVPHFTDSVLLVATQLAITIIAAYATNYIYIVEQFSEHA